MKRRNIIKFVACFSLCFACLLGLAKQNEKKFYMSVDIDLFQFEGEELSPSQEEINKDLSSLKAEELENFKGSLSLFLDNIEIFKDKFNELNIRTKVYENDGKKFSALVEIFPYHHGANGCPSRIKAFNYKIENSCAKKLNLNDIAKNNEARNHLIELA